MKCKKEKVMDNIITVHKLKQNLIMSWTLYMKRLVFSLIGTYDSLTILVYYKAFRIVDSEDYYEYPSDITVTKKTTSELKFVNYTCNV